MVSMLQARPAVRDDWARLLSWRNEAGPESFLAATKVTVPEHVKWLDAVIGSSDTRLFVVSDGVSGVPIGTFRIDRKVTPPQHAVANVYEGACEVSLTIGREHRSKGYGAQVLQLARSAVFRGTGADPKRILARVRDANPVSMRLFVSAGYKVVEKVDDVTVLSLENETA